MTDAVPLEARAATTAGLYAVLLVRPGNAPLSEEALNRWPAITNVEGLAAVLG